MRKSILIADDHHMVVESLEAILGTEKDFKIIATASDGRQVIELAQKMQPQIALIDICMPGLNGFETTLRLQAVSSHTRVIALSMHTEHHVVRRMLRAGACGYMLKESAHNELIKAIKTVLAGDMYICNDIVQNGFELELDDDEYILPTHDLSNREREVLQLILEGNLSKEIAEVLKIKMKTVESHRKHIMDKLAVHGIAKLTRTAIGNGMDFRGV